jgi:shikimate dehydrogenase
MMNAVFEALNVPAVYLALQADDLEEDLETLSKLGVQGISVTIPHKESAYRLASSTDEPAHAMGAVNTLRLHGTQWEGRNTDWIGANAALGHHLETFTGRRALVIGAGGAARAVVYGLKREEVSVTISNRGIERGENLAKSFHCDFIALSEFQQTNVGRDFDIIVQCTPIGLMNEDESTLVPDNLFRPGMVVLDTVYRPLWTPFLRKARAADCVTVSGVEMLLHQGIAQLEWWFGELIRPEVALPVMKKALMGALEDE